MVKRDFLIRAARYGVRIPPVVLGVWFAMSGRKEVESFNFIAGVTSASLGLLAMMEETFRKD